MATVQSPAPTVHRGVQPLRAGQGTSFLWRKLHSLLGIVPIGAFLLEHLLSNFEALKGPLAYGEQVKFLNSLPLVRVLEWVFIFLPILYHGALRRLDLAARQVQHRLLPVGRQLDVPGPALHRPHRLRLHRSARLASALHRHHAPRASVTPPSIRCRSSSPIPGCSPSTSSP